MDLRRLSGLYHSPPSLRLVECTQLKEGRKEGRKVCVCVCVCVYVCVCLSVVYM